MKKKLLIGIGLVVLLVIGAAVYLIMNVNPIVKQAINTFGPKFTGTETRVSDVNLSIFSGQGSISGLFIGNPDGFKEKSLLTLDKLSLKLDTGSLTKPQIVVDSLVLNAPHITYEQTGRSESNFEALLANIQKATGGDGKAEPAETKSDSGQGKTLLIRDFLLTGGVINLAMTGLGGEAMTVNLPDIHLTNVGGDTPPAEVVSQIMTAVYKQVQQALLGIGVQVYENGKKVLEGLGDTAKQAGEQVGGAAKDAVKGLQDMGKSLF
ncbi:MAG: hypothetical protein AB7D57_10590 [Desulfovibrionaceae bacterium]